MEEKTNIVDFFTPRVKHITKQNKKIQMNYYQNLYKIPPHGKESGVLEKIENAIV